MNKHHLVGPLPYYELRQAFFTEGIYLNYYEIQRHMQSHEAYKALPAKVSQQILRKSKPDAFAHAGAKGIAAYVVQPVRLAISV